MGSFVSLDLVLFFLFFELTLVPSYFLIGGWGYARRGYAAIKFFVYTFAGSAFLLVGHRGHGLHPPVPDRGAHLRAARPHAHPSVGHRGRAPVPRLHRRLRRQGPDLPLPHLVARRLRRGADGGSVLLVAVMAKLGTYGIVRFDLNLFPQASRTLAPLLLTSRSSASSTAPWWPAPSATSSACSPTRRWPRSGSSPSALRPQQPGSGRRCPPDGQPRPDHRHPVPPGRVDLRAAQDLADRSLRGLQSPAPMHGRRLHRGHDGVDRACPASTASWASSSSSSAPSWPTGGGRWWPPPG